MALTKREQEIIDRLIDRQMQLENLIVGRISPMAGLGLRVMREDPFNSPLVISEKEHRSISKRLQVLESERGKQKSVKCLLTKENLGFN